MNSNRHMYRHLLCLLMAFATGFAHADGEDPLQIKAGYLSKLARFAEWPATLAVADSFQICILGDDIVKLVAGIMENTKIEGRLVQVVNAKLQSDLSTCRVLYIDAAESWRINAIVAMLGHHPTLTISDAEDFCTTGGIISLVKESDRVKFEINQTAAAKSELKISSLVLAMARKVYRGN